MNVNFSAASVGKGGGGCEVGDKKVGCSIARTAVGCYQNTEVDFPLPRTLQCRQLMNGLSI